jgi:transposase
MEQWGPVVVRSVASSHPKARAIRSVKNARISQATIRIAKNIQEQFNISRREMCRTILVDDEGKPVPVSSLRSAEKAKQRVKQQRKRRIEEYQIKALEEFVKSRRILQDAERCLNLTYITNWFNNRFFKENPYSKETVRKILHSRKIRYGKLNVIPAGRNTDYMRDIRKKFAFHLKKSFASEPDDDTEIISVDQSGVNCAMRQTNTWMQRGFPAFREVKSEKAGNKMLTAAISSKRNCVVQWDVHEGSYTMETAFRFLRNLIHIVERKRTAKKETHNVVILLDNAPVHNIRPAKNPNRNPGNEKLKAEFREFLSTRASWLRLQFTPPYSPFLNPIEFMWRALKEDIRRWAPVNYNSLFITVKKFFSEQKDARKYFQMVFRKYLDRALNGEVILA